MKRLSFVVACVIVLVACATNDSEAIRALYDNGFSNIAIQDRGFMFAHFHGCGEKDGNWYEANALNPIGKPVHMLVCCGALISFKGCTIRSK